MKNLLREFREFLKEYKITALAVAFIMGSASTSLVNSLVKDIVMPVVSPILSGPSWREAILEIGPIHIAYGSFLAEFINFTILALVVFLIGEKLLKREKKEEKK